MNYCRKTSQEQVNKYELEVIEQKKSKMNVSPITAINNNIDARTIDKVKYLMNSAIVRKSSSSGNIFGSHEQMYLEKRKKQLKKCSDYSSPFDRIQLLTSSKKQQRSPLRKPCQQNTTISSKFPNDSFENRRKIYNLPYYLENDIHYCADQDPKSRQIKLMYQEQQKTQRFFNFSETVSTTSSTNSHELKITDFIIVRQLGAGKFGQVCLAMHKESGFICAIKRIPKNGLDEVLTRQLIRQIKIQMHLNHPNIVKLYTFFADKQCIYLVLELCISGQLYHLLRKKKRLLSQQLAKVIIRQVCQGLDCIHQNNIIHRDLKPENILYHHGMMKICDFGWSVDTHLMRNTFCGTPLYISPELLKRNSYDKKIDLWSLGVLSYEILLGKVPFQIFSEADYIKIINNDIKLPVFGEISQEAKDFLTLCLQKDPEKRLETDQMLKHPFLSQVEVINFPQIF